MLRKRLLQSGSLLVCLFVTLGCSQERQAGSPASPTVVEVPPAGTLADVDTTPTVEMVQQLNASATRTAAIRQITEDPSQYAPPVLYALASAMFSDGKQDEALFWFYLGQLRARSDASKCNDMTARQAVQVLNMQYGGPINEFAFKDTEKLRGVVSRVLEWDQTHSRDYDPRWIALHGMGAFTGDSEPFAPESEWPEIDRSTRDDYRKGFEEALIEFAKVKAAIDTNGDGVMSDDERSAHEAGEMARFKEEVKQRLQELENEE